MPSVETKTLFPAIALCLLNWIDFARATTNQRAGSSSLPTFDWATLEPSSDLRWHECYSPSATHHLGQQILSPPSTTNFRNFSCVRLSLPLDYHNTTNPYNVSVPILKVSSPPSSSHRGTIVTALGGAGNSRIQDLKTLSSAGDFLELVDPDYEYDFVTFDNRGFGYSSPSAKCFDNVLDGALWEERMADLGGVMSTREGEEGLLVRISAAKAKGELCAKQHDKNSDIRRYMTTVYAARDMLEILKRFPGQSEGSSSSRSEDGKISKLKFLGLSYGTVVGQTFASLYPEHVDRMVLDGTGDAKDWVDKWQMQHLIDTEAVWATFYEDCFGSKAACPLWRESDSRADIENRVIEFMEKLRERPAYIVSEGNARLVTYRDVKLAMYWTTMAPGYAAPLMATILDGLMKGHTNVTLDYPFESIPTASNSLNKETQDTLANSNSDAGTAVNCEDAEDITNSSLSDFKGYLSALEDQSSLAAFFQGERKIRCLGWPIRPVWRFTGPFTTKAKNGSSKLSTPILFMSNRLDPMTSLHGARKAVKGFPGSVILEQNGRGHCALGNAVPSPCTLTYLREYFSDGSLPEPGTVCGEDCNLFDGSCFGEGRAFPAGFLR